MLRSLILILPLLVAIVPSRPTPQYNRILFAGNSITWSPPIHDIYSDWWGDYGMAATQAQHAYPLLVWAGISSRQSVVPEMDIYKARVIFPEDIDQELFDYIRAYQPDVFILQTGEAFPPDRTQAWWNELFLPLGDVVREVGAVGIVAGVFGTKSISGITPGDNKQEQMRIAVELAGLRFVPLVHLHTTENMARADGLCSRLPDAEGVCQHPGNGGHAGIARSILAAIYSQSAYLPLVHSEGGGTVPP